MSARPEARSDAPPGARSPGRTPSTILAATLALVGAALVPGAATAGPTTTTPPATAYRMPFPCGDVWTGSTRSSHSPSSLSVDFNRTGDLGAPTVAAAPGVVTKAVTTTSGGYGRHVVIDHGAGESSVYAHLDRVLVKAGQRVDVATQIGNVGKSGRVTGPHLHFEEKIGSLVVQPWFDQKRFAWGTQTSLNCVDVPLSGTFGSRKATPVVYRRERNAAFVIKRGTTTTTVPLGTALDEPVVGDWNGDGTSDVGVRTAGTGTFRLKTGTAAPRTVAFGVATDRPLAGDWDGDGLWDIGVYRAASQAFLLRLDTGKTVTVPFAGTGLVPVTGDFDGDGASDVGVYDTTTRTYTLRTVHNDRITFTRHVLGQVGDLPVTGDWDGNGVTDLGTWSPRTGTYRTWVGTFAPPAIGATVSNTTARISLGRVAPADPGNVRAVKESRSVRFGRARPL